MMTFSWLIIRVIFTLVTSISLANGLISSSPMEANADFHLNYKPISIAGNTSSSPNTFQKKSIFAPSFGPSMPSHLSNLANIFNMVGMGTNGHAGGGGGLRSIMMGGMLYGLSLLPAVVMALGGSGLSSSGLLSSLGLSRRSTQTSSASLPMLSENQTRKLLEMLQMAFKQWNIADEHCKQLFVCQMYKQVSSNGVIPDLELFKEALLHILERGGRRKAGRAIQNLLKEYEHYFEAARMGMDHAQCETQFPQCKLTLHSNNRFNKDKNNKQNKGKTAAKKKGDTKGYSNDL